MSKKLNVTGQRFGRLVAISPIKYKPRTKWLFECDCGIRKSILLASVTSGTTKSCGCLRKDQARKLRLPPGTASLHGLYSNYQQHALNRDLEFNLTRHDFARLTSMPCHYCGSEPSQSFKGRNNNGPYTYNGIDRSDNSLGYSLENCVPCCKICNYAKRNMKLEEFTSWIDRLVIKKEKENGKC